ncbi:MAG: YigZ family protein [Clostridia bacterium]|nr:YigZ family protein [Clostridia bacterium]
MYKTLANDAQAETNVKHSKFLAFCFPVSDQDEAEERIRGVKKQFPDATHAPYAYVCGENGEKFRASDDGEPSGTSGVPILEAIKRRGLTYSAVVVVRYFGGIKLGTGGLARAYADAADAAMLLAGATSFDKCAVYAVKCEYACFSALQNKIFSLGGQILSSDFDSGASFTAAIPVASSSAFVSFVADVSSGRATADYTEERFCPIR